jgi:hypothetical protein
MSEIKPALTGEEWESVKSDIVPETALGGHALAAMALHGQPFGFTHDDVLTLRLAADTHDNDLDWKERCFKLRDTADRIEALLPPEDVAGATPSTKDIPAEEIKKVHDYLREKYPLPPEKITLV